ncbi:MAG: SCO family protein [Betaproteobacteria bacterium]|nr:SCO family protein [Betaproteobacteria bacterium]
MLRRTVLAGAALVPLAYGVVRALGGESAPSAGPRGRHFPNVPLLTHENERVRFYDDLIKGKHVAINFTYAQCSEICPMMTANLVKVQRILGERVGRDIFMYSISLTPEQDTPAVLKDYAKNFGVKPGWLFLTGAPEDIELLRRALGFVDPDPEVDRQLTSHSGVVLYGNEPLGRWAACPALSKPEQVAESILWLDKRPRYRIENGRTRVVVA